MRLPSQVRGALITRRCPLSSLLIARDGLTARRVPHLGSLSARQAFASLAPPPLFEDVVEVPVGGAGSISLT